MLTPKHSSTRTTVCPKSSNQTTIFQPTAAISANHRSTTHTRHTLDRPCNVPCALYQHGAIQFPAQSIGHSTHTGNNNTERRPQKHHIIARLLPQDYALHHSISYLLNVTPCATDMIPFSRKNDYTQSATSGRSGRKWDLAPRWTPRPLILFMIRALTRTCAVQAPLFVCVRERRRNTRPTVWYS